MPNNQYKWPSVGREHNINVSVSIPIQYIFFLLFHHFENSLLAKVQKLKFISVKCVRYFGAVCNHTTHSNFKRITVEKFVYWPQLVCPFKPSLNQDKHKTSRSRVRSNLAKKESRQFIEMINVEWQDQKTIKTDAKCTRLKQNALTSVFFEHDEAFINLYCLSLC